MEVPWKAHESLMEFGFYGSLMEVLMDGLKFSWKPDDLQFRWDLPWDLHETSIESILSRKSHESLTWKSRFMELPWWWGPHESCMTLDNQSKASPKVPWHLVSLSIEVSWESRMNTPRKFHESPMKLTSIKVPWKTRERVSWPCKLTRTL